jgi:hypothetical protein
MYKMKNGNIRDGETNLASGKLTPHARSQNIAACANKFWCVDQTRRHFYPRQTKNQSNKTHISVIQYQVIFKTTHISDIPNPFHCKVLSYSNCFSRLGGVQWNVQMIRKRKKNTINTLI